MAKVEPLANVNVAVVPGSVMVTLFTVVAVAAPNTGVTSVGVLANTSAPVPVSSVTADAKLAELGVPKNVATSVPKPEIPEDTGSPVALVSVTLEGVPRAGVTNVGLLAKTSAPDPVSSVMADARLAELGVPKNVAIPDPNDVMPVPPLATGSVPVTPVVNETLVMVLLLPLMVLLVSVCVAVVPVML